MQRHFPAWSKTECDSCSSEFQVTRVYSKDTSDPVICESCEMYNRGYKDGFEAARITPTTKVTR